MRTSVCLFLPVSGVCVVAFALMKLHYTKWRDEECKAEKTKEISRNDIKIHREKVGRLRRRRHGDNFDFNSRCLCQRHVFVNRAKERGVKERDRDRDTFKLN